MKNVLAGAHQMNKLLSSGSVGEDLRTISWTVQVLIFWIKISIFFILIAAFHLYFVHAINLVKPLLYIVLLFPDDHLLLNINCITCS